MKESISCCPNAKTKYASLFICNMRRCRRYYVLSHNSVKLKSTFRSIIDVFVYTGCAAEDSVSDFEPLYVCSDFDDVACDIGAKYTRVFAVRG